MLPKRLVFLLKYLADLLEKVEQKKDSEAIIRTEYY